MRIRLPLADSPYRHFGTHLFIAALTISCLAEWFTDGWVRTLVKVVTGVGTAWGLLGMILHKDGCEVCFEQMPLDPSEQAQRSIGWLRLNHCVNGTPWRSLLSLLALILAFTLASLLPETAKRLTSDATVAFVLVSEWGSRVHARLMPWCPQCRRGGGWDDPAAVPDPSMPHTV